MLFINIRDRNNIQVLNHNPSFVSVRGASREYGFEGAKDGVPSIIPMPFSDIEFAHSRNPNLFATGILTFKESEREEVYSVLNISNWKDTIWTEENIENALLYPTKAKMERICTVKDILTIERIRGRMMHLCNAGIRRPIENVINVVNGRWKEIQHGQRVSTLAIFLPEERDEEKNTLKMQNARLEQEMEEMKKMLAALMAAQQPTTPDPTPAPAEAEEKPKTTRKRTAN